MGVSTLRFVLQKSIEDVELKEALLATCGEGERELAPSGRPRRGEGASEAGSWRQSHGIGVGVGRASARVSRIRRVESMEGVSGRGSRAAFTRWSGQAVLAESASWLREQMGRTGEVTGTSAVGRSKQEFISSEPVVVGNTPCGRPGRVTKALGRRENAQAPESRAQARWGR